LPQSLFARLCLTLVNIPNKLKLNKISLKIYFRKAAQSAGNRSKNKLAVGIKILPPPLF